MAVTVRQLDLSEGLVQAYYKRARMVMAAEAHRLQKEIRWGTGTSQTVEVEMDATVVCKWREEVDGELVYYYYCYIGMRQRGSTEHFALMPLGVSKSVGEGRVNPESSEAYHRFCQEVLGANKHNLLSMTDGAGSYRCRCSKCTLAFEEHHYVNHSRKPNPEFSRPIDAVVADVSTGSQRPSMAGTMTIDKEWDLLKGFLPNNLTARNAADMERTDEHVRAQQFRRMVSNGDRWNRFLEAAGRWSAGQDCKVALKLSMGNLAVAVGRTLQAKTLERRQDVVQPLACEQDESYAAIQQPDEFVQEEHAAAIQQRISPLSDLQMQSATKYGTRYFESQAAGSHCGLHALNNLCGGPQFSTHELANACGLVIDELGAEADWCEDRSLHELPNGWYSHSVLAKAFDLVSPPTWKMVLSVAGARDWDKFSNPGVAGCLVNLKNTHWASMVQHSGCIFYVDSLHLPVLISKADYMKIISSHPLTFFVVAHDSHFG